MKSSSQRTAVFLDRDGTLMEDLHYVGSLDRVVMIPGAARALWKLQEAGFLLFVVTNQSGIARGYFPREAVEQIHQFLDSQFGSVGVRFARYFVCPHHPEDLCDCRKPHPKFLQQAAEEFLLDLPHCYMVGDRASDIQTGINAGTKTVLVLTGAGRDVMNSRSVAPDFVASDIAGAADWIVADSAAHRQPRS